MNESKKMRRSYFIKKAFQMKVIGQFVLLLIIGSVISGILLYFLASSELQANLRGAHMTIRNTWDILLPSILITQISIVVLISLATVYVVLFLSHKIAGPMYKFEKVAEEIGKGNFTVNTNLRKKDELLPLQKAFQNMIENLKSKIKNFEKSFDEFKSVENELHDAIQNSKLSEEEKRSLASALSEFIKQNENNVKAFTL